MTSAPAYGGLLGAAFCAGIVDAMVGGGGLLQVPALFSALPGIAPAVLLGTSKLAGAMGTSVAAWRYATRLELPWRSLAPGCILGVAGGLAGAALATRAPVAWFRPLVPVLLAVVLACTLVMRRLGEAHAPQSSRRTLVAGAFAVTVIAVYDGFFGPGTGSFFMFALIRTQGFDFLHASGAARVLNVSTNIAALGWFLAHGDLFPVLGLAMGAANMAGSLVGTRFALRGGTQTVRRAFIVVVLGLIVKTGRDAWLAAHPA